MPVRLMLFWPPERLSEVIREFAHFRFWDFGFSKATAKEDVNYQWRFNGADIPGATRDQLLLPAVQASQAGVYQLIASNRYGIAATRPTSLTIIVPLADSLDATNLLWTNSTSGRLTWVRPGEHLA